MANKSTIYAFYNSEYIKMIDLTMKHHTDMTYKDNNFIYIKKYITNQTLQYKTSTYFENITIQ